MHDIFLTSAHAKILTREQKKTPRWRFMKYYIDLFNLYGKTLPESIFTEGSQYSYSELGEAVLDELDLQGKLKNLDIFVASYWANEFDPNHASCGAYFSEKYQFQCKTFDVCEQGTLSAFTGIKIIHNYLAQDEINKAILVIMEQTTIPRIKEDHDLVPTQTGTVALLFDRQSQAQKLYKIAAIELFNEFKMANNHLTIFDFLFDTYFKYESAPSENLLLLKKNSQIWKYCKFYANKNFNNIKIIEYSSQPGSLQPFIGLNQLLQDLSYNPRYITVIDEDVESLNSAVLVLEQVGYPSC